VRSIAARRAAHKLLSKTSGAGRAQHNFAELIRGLSAAAAAICNRSGMQIASPPPSELFA